MLETSGFSLKETDPLGCSGPFDRGVDFSVALVVSEGERDSDNASRMRVTPALAGGNANRGQYSRESNGREDSSNFLGRCSRGGPSGLLFPS